MTCVPSDVRAPVNLAAVVGPCIGGLVILVALIIALLYWRKMIVEVAIYKQNWNKRRSVLSSFKIGLHCGSFCVAMLLPAVVPTMLCYFLLLLLWCCIATCCSMILGFFLKF